MTEYTRRSSGVLAPIRLESEPRPKRPELGEVATTRDGRDITRGYVDALPLLQPQDRVLLDRAGGNYEIYEEIARDDQVKATFEQRRLAVVSCEWDVEPGDTSRKAKKAADYLREQLNHIGWDAITDRMLWGVFYGFAVGELVFASDGATLGLDTIKVRKQRRFGFGPDMRSQAPHDAQAVRRVAAAEQILGLRRRCRQRRRTLRPRSRPLPLLAVLVQAQRRQVLAHFS